MIQKDKNFYRYHRGEIYYADLDPVVGHEQGGVRPVVILQNDVGNYYSPTVIIAPLTKKISKKPLQPTHVILDNIEGLIGASLFMLEAPRAIDKQRFKHYVGRLTREQMQKIELAIFASFGLDVEDVPSKNTEEQG